MTDYLAVCEQAAKAGGKTLLDWVGRFAVREKGPSDLVTEADCASQDAIRAVVESYFPQHEFISEEGETQSDFQTDFCWVVDPLDGTTNYVHQVPHYATSVALVQRGQPLVGVIYDPLHDECYAAERGKGAFLNGNRLKTSGTTTLGSALVAASFSAQVTAPSVEIDQFVAALLAGRAVRRTGSAALNLCYVASGRFDAFWALTTKAWDVAAGVLLVEEAGGIVASMDGGPFDLRKPHPVACATEELRQAFCRLLADAPRLGVTGR